MDLNIQYATKVDYKGCEISQEKWRQIYNDVLEEKKILHFFEDIVPKEKADELFSILSTQIDWTDTKGLPQFNYLFEQFPEIYKYIREEVENKIRKKINFFPTLTSIIVTHLPNGSYSVFEHTHPAQTELKISLGCSRTIIADEKEIILKHGSAVLFGPVLHSVPEYNTNDKQINIVMYFMREGCTFGDSEKYSTSVENILI